MELPTIPVCYFPTTALFVDDSRDFLLNFVLQLDEGLAFRTFDAPTAALSYLQQKKIEHDTQSQRCLREYHDAQHCAFTLDSLTFDLATIHAEIYNPLRFSEPSVVVVDYAMPQMNGLEFCRKLANRNIKKILLTGQADEKIAIDAFNEGLIHRYIKKSDKDAAALITQNIAVLQREYFDGMSSLIARMLPAPLPLVLTCPAFAQLFEAICREKRIVEYYLADLSGSFLLLDDDANVYFLVLRSTQELATCADLALQSGAAADIVAKIRQNEVLPCFGHTSPATLPWSQWANGLVKAQPLAGNPYYRYALISGDALFEVQQDRVLSYNRFLEALDAEELSQPQAS